MGSTVFGFSSAGDKDLSSTATPLRWGAIPEVLLCFTLPRMVVPHSTHCPSSWSLGAGLDSMDNPWREAAEMWKHTFLCWIVHCLSTYPAGSPCALTAPFKWLQISPVSSAERTEIRYDFITVFIRPALDRAYTWQKCSLKNLFSEISACCSAASTGAERH